MRAFRMLTLPLIGSAFAGSVAFAATPKPVVPFDAAEAAWFKKAGGNTLRGAASLKAVDGTLHNCAHDTVQLSPVTKYTTERVSIVFGSANPDFVSVAQMPAPPRPDPAGETYQMTEQCDDTGHFTFANLPDGDYYLIVEVAWHSPTGIDVGGGERIDGGAFGRRLRLGGGETQDVQLAR